MYKISVTVSKNSKGTEMSVKPSWYHGLLEGYDQQFLHGRRHVDTGIGRFEKKRVNIQTSHTEISYAAEINHEKMKKLYDRVHKK